MKHRVIHLLSDEDISLVLTGLTLLERKYMEQDDNSSVLFTQQLYEKFDSCEDVGVINHERI